MNEWNKIVGFSWDTSGSRAAKDVSPSSDCFLHVFEI